MWFKLVVVGLKAAPKPAAEVFCKYSSCEHQFHVNDEALAAFCLPLGPESQTLKDRMAHEVCLRQLLLSQVVALQQNSGRPRLAACMQQQGTGQQEGWIPVNRRVLAHTTCSES